MKIRFPSLASAIVISACIASPALANESDTATIGPVIGSTATVSAADASAVAPIMAAAAAAQAEPESGSALTVSGEATLVSDYRFRGVSQSDEGLAIQGGFTVTHESGFYVGTWASNLAGWGTFGGTNTELDLFAGISLPVGEATIDTGLTWFMYPSGADTTDFAELFLNVSGSAGPVDLTAGVAYAPSQEALGNAFPVGAAPDPGDKEDNLYLSGDASYSFDGAPVTLNAHLGYSDGNPGLGPNGTSIAPTGTYFDWSIGVGVEALPGLTLSAAYVDTDISEADAQLLRPNFATLDGNSISDATVVFSISASF